MARPAAASAHCELDRVGVEAAAAPALQKKYVRPVLTAQAHAGHIDDHAAHGITHPDEPEVRMNEYVDQVRDAFTAQAAGDLEPARRLLRPDAVLNIPAFLPIADPRGFDGMVALLLEMAVAVTTAASHRGSSTRSAQAES
jgi:hypothetical protein